MIDTKDLMLGNWVYDGDKTHFPMYVECIGSDYIYLNFPDNEGDVFESTPKDLQGIPLTAELLTKLGFEPQATNLWKKEEKKRDVLVNIEREFVFVEAFDKRLLDSRGWCHGIKYLHQLQNLFRAIAKDEFRVNL